MNVDELVERFGLHPAGTDLAEIRRILISHTMRERQAQGDGDTEVMKLCSLMLFNAAEPADTLLIWWAKESSMDSSSAIDVQLLCGRGLAATKAHLESETTDQAAEALDYLRACEAADDFEEFTVEGYSSWWGSYFSS